MGTKYADYSTIKRKIRKELYYPELDSLKRGNLQIVNENNLNNVLDSIKRIKKSAFVSIGLQKDSSKNKILLKITNRLYQNSYNNVWKVRILDPKEKNILNE